MLKYLTIRLKKYFFIFLLTNIFFFVTITKSVTEENIFIVDNVKVSGPINLNFSRDKYINKAFLISFEMLMSKVLLSKDLNEISNIKLNKIKKLINSFQITEETYRNDEYKASFKIYYNDKKIKKLLGKKNISFSQPKKITAVFFPILVVNHEIQDFYENFFYKNWSNIQIEDDLIDFILPVEDLDDISTVKSMQNTIEDLKVEDLIDKYDIKNYVFTLMSYQNNKLNIHVKTNFENNKTSKNINYELKNFEDEEKLNYISKDLKIKITDLWKKENVINLSIPLSIRVKFEYKNLQDLDNLKKILYKISIINHYSLEEFNTNNSFFKIYYYGNPKKLSNEFLKFGYQLLNDQGDWILHTHG